jgi:hypothetical protein
VALGCVALMGAVGCSATSIDGGGGTGGGAAGTSDYTPIGGAAGASNRIPMGGAAGTGGFTPVGGMVAIGGGGLGPVPLGADGCPTFIFEANGARCVPPNTPTKTCGAAARCLGVNNPNFIVSGSLTTCVGGRWMRDGTERICDCNAFELKDTAQCMGGGAGAGGQGGEAAGGAAGQGGDAGGAGGETP